MSALSPLSTIGPASRLVMQQVKTFGPRPFSWTRGVDATITTTVRFDDECGNGHNTFSITAEVMRTHDSQILASGCMHEQIAVAFPELAPLIKWHLVSTDGPLHYIENTLYWLGRRGFANGGPNDPPNLAHARSTAVWPDMPEGFVITGTLVSNADVVAALTERLPALVAEFRAAVEALGFVW
jgi:hypothetical protein